MEILSAKSVAESGGEPVLVLSSDQIKKDQTFEITIQVKNDETDVLEGLLSLHLPEGSAFRIVDGKNCGRLNLAQGEEAVVKFPVRAMEDLQAGDYALDVVLEKIIDGKLQKGVTTVTTLTIETTESDISKEQKEKMEELLRLWKENKVKIVDADKPSEEETPKDTQNTTQNETPNIPEPSGPVVVDAGGSGFVPGDFSGDSTGDLSGDGNGEGVNVKNKPKLIISNYTLKPAMPKAGDEFVLDVTFYNTNQEKSVRNIKISLNGAEQGQDAKGAPQQGSVFTPVDSSNTFYISRINAGSWDAKTIKLRTVPNAVAQNYTMNVTFEYEDWEGNEYTATEIIGIPVVQQSKILLGEVRMDEAFQSMPMGIHLDFFNTGKDTLTNLMLTLEGSGFANEESTSYFVGNFAPGASDSYSVSVIPMEEGMLEGKIILTYEDSTGASHKEEVPFSKEVMAGMEEDMSMIDPETGLPIDPGQEAPQGGGGMTIWAIVIGALVLLAAIALLVRRRRRRKKEMEDLEIDENQ